jgi:hypothetical protein
MSLPSGLGPTLDCLGVSLVSPQIRSPFSTKRNKEIIV